MSCWQRLQRHIKLKIVARPAGISQRGRSAVIALLLVGVLGLSSCDSLISFGNRLTGRTPLINSAGTRLDQQALVLKLISCISDTTQVQAVYNSIPSSQLDGISYATFDAYIRALARCKTTSTSIQSFTFPNDAEKKALLDDIATHSADFTDLLERTIPIKLSFMFTVTANPSDNSLNNPEGPFYIYIQLDDKGRPYLSSTWVTESLKIYYTAGLYFEALTKQNEQAVVALIKGGKVPDEGDFSTEVVQYQARELVDFYRVKVQSQPSDFLITTMNIGTNTFWQRRVLDESSVDYSARSVSFVRNSLNNVTIRDSLNKPLDSKEFYLYYNGEKTQIRIGDLAYSEYVNGLFGVPLMIAVGTDTSAIPPADEPANQETAADNNKIIFVTYPSLTITIKGKYYPDGTWNGTIIRIRLINQGNEFSFGSTLAVGMSRDDLLMNYPFANQTDYRLSAKIDEQTYATMSFTFSTDSPRRVTGIHLALTE